MPADLATVPDAVPAHHLPVYALEAALLQMPQTEMPAEHAFVPGLYARTLHIPKGTVLTGAVHREACFFVMRSGTLAVTTDDGVHVLEAGAMLESPAGTKRAGYAMTDVVVTTFHPNPAELRDPVAIWDAFTVPAPASVLAGRAADAIEVTQ